MTPDHERALERGIEEGRAELAALRAELARREAESDARAARARRIVTAATGRRGRRET